MAASSDIVGEALYALVPLALRRSGRTLSLTAVSTLSTLERTGPRRLTDLAVTEEVTQPSMTSLVTQLVDLGYAERRRDSGDARVVLVAITRGGRQHLRDLRRAGASSLTTLIDKLDGPDRAALSAAVPALHRMVSLAAEGQAEQTRRPNAVARRSS